MATSRSIRLSSISRFRRATCSCSSAVGSSTSATTRRRPWERISPATRGFRTPPGTPSPRSTWGPTSSLFSTRIRTVSRTTEMPAPRPPTTLAPRARPRRATTTASTYRTPGKKTGTTTRSAIAATTVSATSTRAKPTPTATRPATPAIRTRESQHLQRCGARPV